MKSVNWPIVRLPVDRVAAAEPEHGGDPERGEEDQAREEARLDARLTHRLRAHRLGAAREPLSDVVLAPEGLHHLDPDDGLVGRLRQVPLLRLHDARDREHLVGEDVRQHGDRRHREGCDRGSRRAFTETSTIAAPTSIIMLWIACTTPQPMK